MRVCVYLFKSSKYFKLLATTRGTSLGQSFQELSLCCVLCVTELLIRPQLRSLCAGHAPSHHNPWAAIHGVGSGAQRIIELLIVSLRTSRITFEIERHHTVSWVRLVWNTVMWEMKLLWSEITLYPCHGPWTASSPTRTLTSPGISLSKSFLSALL